MIIHNMEQGTQEWFDVRDLKLTASKAQAIMTNGKGLDTLCRELCCTHLTGIKNTFTNEHMERGNDLEPDARAVYEMETGRKVDQVGFVEHSKHVGCSPDGFVGDDGLIEIKSPADKAYFDYMLDKKIDTGYMAQMQMQMLLTGRKWCDYVIYNPNFEECIQIVRVLPDEVMFTKLIVGLKSGENKIIEILKRIKDE